MSNEMEGTLFFYEQLAPPKDINLKEAKQIKNLKLDSTISQRIYKKFPDIAEKEYASSKDMLFRYNPADNENLEIRILDNKIHYPDCGSFIEVKSYLKKKKYYDVWILDTSDKMKQYRYPDLSKIKVISDDENLIILYEQLKVQETKLSDTKYITNMLVVKKDVSIAFTLEIDTPDVKLLNQFILKTEEIFNSIK